MTNSRQKGKRGELEVVHLLKEYGFEARRGQQYSGANGDADVIGLPGYHIEVKFREQLNLDAALDQARRDAPPGAIPTVFHRKSRTPWKVTLDAEAFLEIIAALNKFIGGNNGEGR